MTTQHFVVEPQSAEITLNRTGSKTSATVRCFLLNDAASWRPAKLQRP